LSHDLVLKGGRVLDPGSGTDRVADVAFADGKVAEIGDDLRGTVVEDVGGSVVNNSMIDLHTKVNSGVT